MAPPIGLALIGCGELARRYAGASRTIEDLQLTVCGDRNARCAAALAEELGCRAAPLEQALTSPAVDAALVVAHHDAQAELVTMAAQAGKHVLVQAPLAVSVSAARRAVQAVEAAGVLAMVGFPLRLAPMIQLARALLPRPLFANGQAFGQRLAEDIGQPDLATGESGLWGTGLHLLDLVCHLMGDSPGRVHAEGGSIVHPGRPAVETALCSLSLPAGRTASLALSGAGRPAVIHDPHLELTDGTRRIALWDEFRAAELAGFTAAEFERWQPPSLERQTENAGQTVVRSPDAAAGRAALAAQLAAFAELLRSGRFPQGTANLADGQRATAVVRAVLAAIRFGQPRSLGRT